MVAEKRRFLDVWIIESNTVYQEVPFDVVTDWLQQGRLLPDDMTRPSGTADWARLGDSPEFRPWLVEEKPHRPADQAEALEPVIDQGLNYSRKHVEDEDEDVDMIPLIDVSLVLLIFFMLTAAAGGAAVFVNAPATDHGHMVDDPKAVRIDITPDKQGKPTYAVGEGGNPPPPDDSDLPGLPAALTRVADHLRRREGKTNVIINLDKTLPAKIARDALLALTREPFRGRINANFFGVSEKE